MSRCAEHRFGPPQVNVKVNATPAHNALSLNIWYVALPCRPPTWVNIYPIRVIILLYDLYIAEISLFQTVVSYSLAELDFPSLNIKLRLIFNGHISWIVNYACLLTQIAAFCSLWHISLFYYYCLGYTAMMSIKLHYFCMRSVRVVVARLIRAYFFPRYNETGKSCTCIRLYFLWIGFNFYSLFI
jgi:hypothetical protein